MRLPLTAVLLGFAAALAASCAGSGASAPPAELQAEQPSPQRTSPSFRLQQVGSFDRPVHATGLPGTDLVAVVEKRGRVIVVAGMMCAASDNCPSKPVKRGRVVIDVTSKVSTGSEQGLLGFAYHPDWPADPRVFINYTDAEGVTRVEAWRLDSAQAPAKLDQLLLEVPQPFGNHNGGHLAFGPDGYLYIGTGDGGDGGDPGDRAQRVDDLLGKMLRLDVDAGGGRGFAPAPGNLTKGAPEAWAVGLRNPWRYSFDSETGDLWIGDVGQSSHEEINAVSKAELSSTNPNFEWRLREGFSSFSSTGITAPGPMVGPVVDYGRESGCSVTGGVVYRGALIPALVGWYLFADVCSDDVRLLDADGVPGAQPERGELRWQSHQGAAQIVSFGVTQRGEVLVVSLDGDIYQVVEG